MNLEAEVKNWLISGVDRIIHRRGNSYPEYQVSEEPAECPESAEYEALLSSISQRARSIASNVRNKGQQKFGPMWAEGYARLPDGKLVFLQQSQESKNNALIIDISDSSNIGYSVHFRYDLTRNSVTTYRVKQIDSDHKLITAYGVLDCPEQGTRIPADLTLRDIIHPINECLTGIEGASEFIAPTPSAE